MLVNNQPYHSHASSVVFHESSLFCSVQLVAAKTANAKLESEVKQEKGNASDLRKMLADERNVMSTMDVEHQLQLVELEQRHQEKVLLIFTFGPIRSYSYKIKRIKEIICFTYTVCCFILQVLYLLNQLQSKPVCEESDREKQKDGESSNEELLQRLKAQVYFISRMFEQTEFFPSL